MTEKLERPFSTRVQVRWAPEPKFNQYRPVLRAAYRHLAINIQFTILINVNRVLKMLNILKQQPQPNVYQMWFSTRPASVWITRTTWSNLCAKIVSIGEPKGPAPYYGNPEVRADIYSADGQLTQRGATISVPGTYKTWRQIAEPHWAKPKKTSEI